MSEEEKVEVDPKEPVAAEQPNIFETAGRKFDLSTDNGRVGLKNFVDGLSFVTGKLSNEVGDLRKEVAPLRKYKLSGATPDDVSIMQAVEKHRQDGEDDEAIKLLFEYNKQVQQSMRGDMEFERLFSDYLTSNPGVRDSLAPADIEIYKDYVKRNHMDQLAGAENPFAILDSVIGHRVAPKAPAVAKEETKPAEDEGYASLDAGKATSPAAAPKVEDKEPATFDTMLDDLNKYSGF